MGNGKKFLKIIGAVCLTLCMFSDGIFTVRATNDLTDLQWYFSSNKDGHISFPSWNQKRQNSTDYVTNVDLAKKIVIAVVDTGVDYNHEDLQSVMWNKWEMSSDQQAKLTAAGFGDHGINVLDSTNTTDPMDSIGHGTHAAGIIAAAWNGIGVSGALNGVKIMAVKAIASDTQSNAVYVARGLEKVLAAKQAGVNIVAVNLSWDEWAPASNPEILDDVITRLGKAGVVTVMAAGNDGADLSEREKVSTYLRSNPYVIVTAACDETGYLASDENILKSDYSKRCVDVAAPGVDIISTYISSPPSASNTDNRYGFKFENPYSGNLPSGYKSISGTSAAAPMVTAAAALVYNKYSAVQSDGSVKVSLAADEIASRVIETSYRRDGLYTKVYGGLLSPTEATETVKTEPLPYYGRYNNGSLTIWGTDFGNETGTVTLNDVKARVTGWTNGAITISDKTLSLGEYQVQIKRKDGTSSSRWIYITGTTEKTTELDSDGLEGISLRRMTTIGGILYQLGVDPVSEKHVLLTRNVGATSWTKKELDLPSLTIDMGASGNRLYFIGYGTRPIISVYSPSAGKIEKSFMIQEEIKDSTDWHIRVLNNTVYVAYLVNGSSGKAIHVATVDSAGKLSDKAAISGSDRILDLYANGNAIMLMCEDRGDGKETVRVYNLSQSGEKAVFEKEFSSGVSSLNGYGFKDRVLIGPFLNRDQNGRYTATMEEYGVSDNNKKQTVTLSGGHVLYDYAYGYMLDGVIYNGLFYTSFVCDAARHNVLSQLVPLSGYKAPTAASSTGTQGTSGTATASPATVVTTCQDVGYPDGWYWDDAAKACVSPGAGGDSSTPASTNTIIPSEYVEKVKEDYTANPPETGSTETIDPSIDPSPSADVTATPESETEKKPASIINTDGIMWFLGIPVLMIIAGIVMYLFGEGKLIPMIIAVDVLAALILAILDHSVVGWILLILNLAAVGLMALYKTGKKKEEPQY